MRTPGLFDSVDSKRTVIWFSCGAASAVAAYLTLKENPNALMVYCDTHSEHEDNKRFLADVEKWLNKKVDIICSQVFYDVDSVIEKTHYMSGINGAPCTVELKKIPRMNFQCYNDLHVFGYTFDEKARAESFTENNFELDLLYPLILRGITKIQCLSILQEVGIKLPYLYTLGLDHNNCIACVKASSCKYWAIIREYFPNIFQRRCEQSRKLGVRLIKLDKKTALILGKQPQERIFLDELPVGIDCTGIELRLLMSFHYRRECNMSQCEKILEYLVMIPGRRISTWQAYELFHITTLAQRIQDLRQDMKIKPLVINGQEYFINDELVTKEIWENGKLVSKTFSEYWLEPIKVEELQGVLF